MLTILPTLAGLLMLNAEGAAVNGGYWQPCPCQLWAGNGCQASAQVVPLPRCEPYWIIATGEPQPDRYLPLTRERRELIGRFRPADVNFDGFVTVDDLALFTASPWDFDGDGFAGGKDVAAYAAEYQRPGCHGLGVKP